MSEKNWELHVELDRGDKLACHVILTGELVRWAPVELVAKKIADIIGEVLRAACPKDGA